MRNFVKRFFGCRAIWPAFKMLASQARSLRDLIIDTGQPVRWQTRALARIGDWLA